MRTIFHHSNQTTGSFKENRFWGLLLIAPWLIGLVFLKLLPVLISLAFSLTDFYLLEPTQYQFVGLQNYAATIQDANAGIALLQTIKLALIIIPIQTSAAIVLAALLNHPRLRGRNTLRTLFFIPSIFPALSATFMWQGFLNPSSGWLNRLILGPLGLESFNQFYSRSANLPIFIISSLWSIGPGFLIILGAMQAIPAEIHEAARMDGASRLRSFFAITLPLISPATFFTLILNLTGIMGGAVLLDRGNNFSNALTSFDSYVNHILFDSFRLGQASSAAWMFFIFVSLIMTALLISSKYWVYFPNREI